MSDGVVIADDLTGAADACVAFVARGLTGAVVFADPARGAGVDVVATSTESRNAPARVAAARVRDAVERCVAALTPAWIFKKIDSTLRGQPGPEIRAALDASGARFAIVAPAFPAQGRTVEGGMLRVTGRGSLSPQDVLARLADGGLESCVRLDRPWLLEAGQLRRQIRSAVQAGARALVCDGVAQADLDAIVAAASAVEGPVLWAGSAGLAHALAHHVVSSGARVAAGAATETQSGARTDATADRDAQADIDAEAEAPSIPRPDRPRPVVFAIGSTHPVTVAQQQRLLCAERPVARTTVFDTDAIGHCFTLGVDLLVTVPSDAPDGQIARFADTIAARRDEVGGLVMSGGATAARLCRHLDATRIDLGGEVSPGIPWGTLTLGSGERWPVVLKAGGFGTDDDLLRALGFLATLKG